MWAVVKKYYAAKNGNLKIELISSTDQEVFAKYGKKKQAKDIINCFHIKFYFNSERGGDWPKNCQFYGIYLKLVCDEIEFKTDGSDEMYDKLKKRFIDELLPKDTVNDLSKNMSYKITLVSSTDSEIFERYGNH